MNHRELCKYVATWFLNNSSYNLVSWEIKTRSGYADVLATHTNTKRVPKLAICEVKRTRADLLQDLRRKKMLKYERTASHCYLAVTPTAVLNKDSAEVLTDLGNNGLPTYWGVLLITTKGIICIRNPRAHKKIRRQTIETYIAKIARSFMYRVLSPTSPMIDHA